MPRKLTLALLALAAAVTLAQRPPAASGPETELQNLLHPAALANVKTPSTIQELRKHFADPPAEYRSMPLWVWNDELQWPRLKEQLSHFREQGMGGVFVHPRPGLMTEYMGAEWLGLWKQSTQESKRLGMLANIYDENSYPSGFAGGLVPAVAPDTASQYVQAEQDVPSNRVRWTAAETVAVYLVEKDASGGITSAARLTRPEQLPAGRTALVFRLRRASGSPWTAGFPYVDLTNPETAKHFISTTFEPYKRRLGAEFGKTIRWVFDDEPLLATGGAYDQATFALPLSFYTLAEFRRRCGYDLADHMPSLYWDTGEFQKVRFDYWQTLHDLWKENYMRPLFQWCDRNNLQFTGHWMEHTWPFPWISPADASLHAYQHVPGIDMLEGTLLRTKGADPHMLFTIKQTASVAHQLRRRTLCEAYGVAGWDSTFEHYKRFGDWLMVHGVNFMNQHLSFVTVRGARKRDHPQSFSDVAAWWPYYRLHGDHLARVSYLLSAGATANRLLVLTPTTSGFLWARRGDRTPELDRMRADNGQLIQHLADRQMDFDLGDEYILEWFGGQEGRRLAVGHARYDLVLWPAHMINVRSQSLPRLEAYLAAGGEIVALGPPAVYVDGRPSKRVMELRARYAAQWHSVESLAQLDGEIRRRLAPTVVFDPPLPPGVGLSERRLESGERILFLANAGLDWARSMATIEGAGLERWDTVSGRMAPAAYRKDADGRLRVPVNLAPAASELLVVTKAATQPPAEQEPQYVALSAPAWRVTPDAPNVLVLDYCDFKTNGIERRNVNTWRANWLLWQAHGFERPAWDNAVQFKRRVFDRNNFGPDTGFEATFRFEAADREALRGLELAIEAPSLYQVTVNGHPVLFDDAKTWLDPHLKSASMERWTRVGENVITITGRPFDVRMELENIYLRGHFAVVAAGAGFRLQAPREVNFGAWSAQGYPFYENSMTYSTEVDVPPGATRLRLELNAWQGSLAEVLLDGKRAAVLAWPPYAAEIDAASGKRRVEVRVVSTPRNLFGPFHNPTKPRMRAWPAAWSDFPENQPPGAAYDILEYGLTQAPAISAGTRR